MIIAITGRVGSGKTITAVRNIVQSGQLAVTNFSLNYENHYRLKKADILEYDEKGRPVDVNWKFWQDLSEKHESFSVYIDEIHNVIHSRQSMSRRNILLTKWAFQIRKVLKDSLTNHLYLISARSKGIDVAFRDLVDVWVLCDKIVISDQTIVLNYMFENEDDLEFAPLSKHLRDVFSAEPYFKHYGSYKLVFGEEEYL